MHTNTHREIHTKVHFSGNCPSGSQATCIGNPGLVIEWKGQEYRGTSEVHIQAYNQHGNGHSSMATPEEGSAQWNPLSAIPGWTRLLNSLTGLRFTLLYTHINTYRKKKKLVKRGAGRTVTSTSRCDRFQRWRGIMQRQQLLSVREG